MPPQPLHSPGSITELIVLVASLLPGPFASQGFFYSPLFSRFQVVRVFLDFLDDIFLLDLALEATQRVFEGFSLLKSHFSQTANTPVPCVAIRAHSKQRLFKFSRIHLCQVKGILGGWSCSNFPWLTFLGQIGQVLSVRSGCSTQQVRLERR